MPPVGEPPSGTSQIRIILATEHDLCHCSPQAGSGVQVGTARLVRREPRRGIEQLPYRLVRNQLQLRKAI
jgi:hypothetical protein